MMATVSIEIGREDLVRKLFSYPNNFNEVGFLEQTLEHTIEVWLSASIRRDGLAGGAKVRIVADKVHVEFSGDAAPVYRDYLPRYLAIGALALQASQDLNRKKKWKYNWRFLLPHGVPMTRHRVVQLLHFPPDYVLARDQDYLTAHTTMRWAELLVENGAAADTTDQYQNIIDIAPIAAPSRAGKELEGVYDGFGGYIEGLLELWLRDGKTIRPLVAFGSPVRSWLKKTYGIDLRVLQTASLSVTPDIAVPILAANHPSFIYNADDRLKDDPATPFDERVLYCMGIMQQDLVAAAWEVKMAKNPLADPKVVLKECADFWSRPERRMRICELTCIQVFDKTPDEARKTCALLPALQPGVLEMTAEALTSIDAKIEQLREMIGALDSREPDQIPPR